MLITILAAFIALSILIIVHELGHFFAAKHSGVRVERFSLGMGPIIAGFKRGETHYVISAVPFGGYVKMAGEDPEVGGEGGDWEFMSKPKRVRAFIVLAGPVMNIILAFTIFAVIAAVNGIEIFPSRLVGEVVEDSPAWQAGVREGDEILAVAGDTISSWDHLIEVLQVNLGGPVEIVVSNGDGPRTLELNLTGVTSAAAVGMYIFLDSSVGKVQRGSPADRCGLRTGDLVTEIDGQAMRSWSDLVVAVRARPDKEVSITWERDGTAMTSTITPRDENGQGQIGLTPYVARRPVGVDEALREGALNTVWVAKQVLQFPRFFAKLFRGEASRDMVGGPLKIGELAGEVIRWGLGTFAAFIAAISAQLSLLNLLPIPVLDGGHLMLLGVETVTRKQITPRQRMIAHQIGFAFLFGAMILVTLFDISGFIGR